MTGFILQLLGADVADVSSINAFSLRIQQGWWLGVVLVGGLLAVLFSWSSYRHSPQDVKPVMKFFLTTLRSAFLLLLLCIFLRPVLSLHTSRKIQRHLPVIFDTSASMKLGNRLETAKTPIESALAKLTNQVQMARFGTDRDRVVPLGEKDVPEPTGSSTALGQSLESILQQKRGTPLAGVVLVTDGANNQGTSLFELVDKFQVKKIPLYVVGAGDPAPSDVRVEALDVPDVLLTEEGVTARVRLSAIGMSEKSGRAFLTLDGIEISEKKVTFEEIGVQEIDFPFIPKSKGDFSLEVHFKSESEELTTENNSLAKPVRIIDGQMKVLMVEQLPRWEFKYIQAMLLRERRVVLDCVLFDSDPEVTRIPGSPYLENFPSRIEELFAYDLIILGDVAPDSIGRTGMEHLADYISRAGGSLVVIAGKNHNPAAYRHTALENLLPVELRLSTGNSTIARLPQQLSLTEAGRRSPMLRLSVSDQANDLVWSKLPPIFWTSSVSQAKPAAEVLLVNPQENNRPVIAMQRYGAGEIIFVGTDNTWRWRKNSGDTYHTRFWGQIVQRMAGFRLLGGQGRTRISSDRSKMEKGDRVTVRARLFTRGWQPRTDSPIKARVEIPGSGKEPATVRSMKLYSIPSDPGSYRGEFVGSQTGHFRITVDNEGSAAQLNVTVGKTNLEMREPAMQEAVLRETAAKTGGAFFLPSEAENLANAITRTKATVTLPIEVDLWASPLYFLLLLTFLTVEWVLRKRSELK